MTAALKIKHELVNQLDDIQSSADRRCLAIQSVGIKGLTYPIIFNDKRNSQQTRASFNLYVSLAADQRGTHMSRFISLKYIFTVPAFKRKRNSSLLPSYISNFPAITYTP
jgi:GTP cyclohydrolase FolE2